MHSNEELIEEGIVVKAENGELDIELLSTGECEHCSAKLICKPRDENSQVLHLKDPIKVKPGDRVRINLKESALFKASILLYGIPLILLFAGIFIGLSIFSIYSSAELFSFLFAVILIAIYFSLLLFVPGLKEKVQEKPRITLIR